MTNDNPNVSGHGQTLGYATSQRSTRPSRLGILSVIFAALAVLLLAISFFVIVPILRGIIARSFLSSGTFSLPSEFSTWMAIQGLCDIGSILSVLTALTLGIIGVVQRRKSRKWAVIGLSISGALILFVAKMILNNTFR